MLKVLTCICLVFSVCVGAEAQPRKDDRQYEPLVDLKKDDFHGEPPSQAKIEAAFKECLQQIDDEVSSVRKSTPFRKEHIAAESAICDKSRRNCVVNPKSIECRGFVEDYADSLGE